MKHMEHGKHLSAEKARMMLEEGTAKGKKITKKQKKFFGAVAHGMKPMASRLRKDTK